MDSECLRGLVLGSMPQPPIYSKRPAFAARGAPGKALYLADAPNLTRLDARLTAAGARLDAVPRLPLDQAADYSLDIEAMEAGLAEVPGGASLLVLDALRVGLARDGDLNQYSRLMFESLAAAAERHGIAVLACVRLPGLCVTKPSGTSV